MTIDDLKHALRATLRMKDGVDYAITHKYGVTHLFCHEAFKELILEEASACGIAFKEVHTFKT